MCKDYDTTIKKRRLVLSQIKDISSSLEPCNSRLKALLPIDSPPRNLNPALIEYLAEYLDFPDRHITSDLIRGMPLTGEIEPAKSLPHADNTAKTTLQEVMKEVRDRNTQLIKTLKNRPKDAIKKCWDMTQEEVKEGKVS